MADVDDGPYRVKALNERFEVLDASDRVVIVCRDEGSANQYAVLFNEAFRRGYKAGYRDARKGAGLKP